MSGSSIATSGRRSGCRNVDTTSGNKSEGLGGKDTREGGAQGRSLGDKGIDELGSAELVDGDRGLLWASYGLAQARVVPMMGLGW